MRFRKQYHLGNFPLIIYIPNEYKKDRRQNVLIIYIIFENTDQERNTQISSLITFNSTSFVYMQAYSLFLPLYSSLLFVLSCSTIVHRESHLFD